MKTNGIEGKKQRFKKKGRQNSKKKGKGRMYHWKEVEQINQRKLNYKSSWDSDKTLEVKVGNKEGKENLDQWT